MSTYCQWCLYIKTSPGTNKIWCLYTEVIICTTCMLNNVERIWLGTWKCGPYKHVVFMYRTLWCLEQVLLYIHFQHIIKIKFLFWVAMQFGVYFYNKYSQLLTVMMHKAGYYDKPEGEGPQCNPPQKEMMLILYHTGFCTLMRQAKPLSHWYTLNTAVVQMKWMAEVIQSRLCILCKDT